MKELLKAASTVLSSEQQLDEAKFTLPPKMQAALDAITAANAELTALQKQMDKLNMQEHKLLEKIEKLKEKYMSIDHTFASEKEEEKAMQMLLKAMNS